MDFFQKISAPQLLNKTMIRTMFNAIDVMVIIGHIMQNIKMFILS